MPIQTSLVPWLSVHGSAKAVEFYKTAFAAKETYRLDIPDGSVVARLSIDGAEFWVSDGSGTPGSATSGDLPVRMILTVADPDTLFDRVIAAGASLVYPVSESHGWRLGRLQDPFGHHWEIGYPLAD